MVHTKEFMKQKTTCNHCGGIMADYRGMVTCVMCGRAENHHCQNCANDHKPKLAKAL